MNPLKRPISFRISLIPEIPCAVSECSIATALSLDGTFEAATLDDFLVRVFTPETTA
ncbi:hypothetical protein [Nonomuraea sp. NPDC049158]|uniref:hypothetical protein n=1 Tax=Nonomuraea sp. NPDC049158 TaxID=3155649 RepID=UPI0033E9D2A4